ncbi:MAG: hypothetical protein NDI61_10965 [Bdellovibrionaceae bacterium]|nr:hypothetical protein [Pseudobdellovibrionaceae bacterium]
MKSATKSAWFSVLMALVIFLPSAEADSLPSSTQVRGKILMVDCSRLLVEAAARDLKDDCVVFYSGVWTIEGKNGLWAENAEGNIGFAKESTGVLNFVGKHAQLDINLNNGRIKSVENPD